MNPNEFAESCRKFIEYDKKNFEWYSEYAGDTGPLSNFMLNPETCAYDKEAWHFLKRDENMHLGKVLYYFNLFPVLTLRAFIAMKQMRERHQRKN